MVDGNPCTIVENEFVKPGKGQAFNRVKYRNLKTNRIVEKNFRSGESVEAADVVEVEWQYLYNDGSTYHFMNPSDYEQHAIDKEAIGDSAQWIKEETICTVVTWQGRPLSVFPPKIVALSVDTTEPGIKGDTVTGATKPATLETGAVVKVPIFINEGEIVRIDTRTGEYLGRTKE